MLGRYFAAVVTCWLAGFFTSNFTLAQEAGQGTKYLIVHADDAGMSHSANRGTIEGLEQGIVTSASILVPCPWFLEFADYCKQHPQGDYGIHLTLTSEWTNYRWGPVSDPSQVSSLVDPQGYLWDNVGQVAQHVDAAEAKLELSAQIERALKFGIPLSHLDTHMGALFSRPDLLAVYVDLGIKYNLPILFIDTNNSEIVREYPALVVKGQHEQRRLAEHNLPVLDMVGQFYGGENHQERRQKYISFLRSLKPGVTELIIHCGFDDPELQAITTSASRRNGDRLIFTDPAIAALVQELDIQLIDWKQFRELRSTLE